MRQVDKETYFQLTEKFKEIPLNQSYGWYAMNSLYHPEKIIFLINDTANPTIACIGHIKKAGTLKMLLIEGERYINEDAVQSSMIKKFYSEIVTLGYDMVEICSNAIYHFNYEIGMRQAGFLRPVGQFCFPSTKMIDLTLPISYNRNWKRNLQKASEQHLIFEVVEHITMKDIDDFLKIYLSLADRKKISFTYTPKQIYNLCLSKDFQLFFVSSNLVRQVSFIVYRADNQVTPLYAASNENALETSATYFMYEQLFNYYKQSGIKKFDMAKLLPSTKSINNVFLFKNGVKGSFIQLNGEWSWYKHSIYRIGMYFVKKYLFKKRET